MNTMIIKPCDIKVGDQVYCGLRGMKMWRKITKIEVVSIWRYNIFTDGDWSVSAGSGCKFLIKGTRTKCDF